ncbi:MAG: hypothetical protein MHM6MM_006461 [Cercozoa sp. M6MM]
MAEEHPEAVDAPIVAFFAHKGGVSKTTNVLHLGWKLAQQFGQRVILVDGDPQCNLTQTLVPRSRTEDGWRDDVPCGNFYSCLQPLHYGHADPGEQLPPAELVMIKPKHFRAAGDGELLLLPGSLKLATLEPQLTMAHTLTSNASNFPLFFNIAGGAHSLLRQTARHYDADIVLLDMGPSIGELNKNLFMSCDYFVTPVAPDQYCHNTVKTMETVLPKWHHEQRALARATKHQTMPVNPVAPRFLGVVLSLFQVAGAQRRPVRQSAIWMQHVKNQVEHCLVPTLQERDMVVSVEDILPAEGTLAEIPNFLSLMPIAQRANYPVFAIPDEKYTELNEATGEYKPMAPSKIKPNQDRAKVFDGLYANFATVLLQTIRRDRGEEATEEF